MKTVLAVAAVALLAAAAFYVIGPERIWALSGPPDLGDVDFATMQRRDTPNDALACGEGLCAAKADMPPPVFSLPAAVLFPKVEQALRSEPRLEQVARAPEQGVLRYVQRSAVFRFPDTINVKIVALPDGGSTVLLYSRSQIGRGDMGVNRDRVARWIGLIEAEARK